jgi:hypothetical protein
VIAANERIDTMAIDGARIQRVTQEGLFYLDDEGREKFISFALCHLNYVMEFVDRSQQYTREKRDSEIQWRRTHKRIADTGSGGYPFDSDLPCMEFFTNPPSLFEFATYEIFSEIRRVIWDYGWMTFDRS